MFNFIFKFMVIINVCYFHMFESIANVRNIVVLRIVSEILNVFRMYPEVLACKCALDVLVREPLNIAYMGGMIRK
jgi:hypothetical protein